MKTVNKLTLISILILTLTPPLIGGYYFTSLSSISNCQSIISEYTKYIPTLECPQFSITSYLPSINNAIQKNKDSINNFETQNQSQATELKNLILKLDNSKYQLTQQPTYAELLNLQDKILTDNTNNLQDLQAIQKQLLTYQDLISDLNITKDITQLTSLQGLSLLQASPTLKAKEEAINNIFLKSRNNKQSLTDIQYLTLKKSLKSLTAQEFLDLSNKDSVDDSNRWNKTILSPQADKVFYDLAFKRGYRFRKLVSTQELTGTSENDLTRITRTNLDALFNAAAKDNIKLRLASGYRNPDTQKLLFLSRLNAECNKNLSRDCTTQDVVDGLADTSIEKVLSTSSVPATSKHHTGRTADINQVGTGDLLQFKDTQAYQWIKTDNFFNLKRFGFVPSYPPEGANMGPNPEEWEIMYVGTDALTR
jgi:LAS superfamily LD-carboxypeptidase LdcB